MLHCQENENTKTTNITKNSGNQDIIDNRRGLNMLKTRTTDKEEACGDKTEQKRGKPSVMMDSIGFWNTKELNIPCKQEDMNLYLHNNKNRLVMLLDTKVKKHKAQHTLINLCL